MGGGAKISDEVSCVQGLCTYSKCLSFVMWPCQAMDGELLMPDFCEAKQDLLVYTAICPRIVAASSRHMVLT